jgi:branched-chain amino acid transport system ATP-binding protein
LLTLDKVSVSYGPVQALRDVSLHVGDREIVALLGANGAGKSTTLRAISGVVPVSAGAIRFGERELTGREPHEIVRLGISHAPEGRRVFPEISVAENLDLGGYVLRDPSAVAANLERAYRYFPLLAQRRRQKAATLSGGEQQMLAVARALMSSPRLLLLDEPSLGLAPMLVDQIFEIVRQINREEGVAMLLVEQNANEALLHADRAYVMETGRLTLEGPAAELRKDPRVVEAYLGG